MITIDILMKYFKQVENNRGSDPFWKYRALCPAHNDHDPSLIIGISNDGKRMKLRCESRKCLEKDIIAKAKVPPELLIRDKPDSTHEYLTLNWEVAYRVERYNYPKGKKCPIFYMNKKGEWKKGLGPASRILYNLPYINEADHNEYVFFVEGEKNADDVRKLGLLSSTTCEGSDNWAKTQDWSILEGKKVVLIPDNDKPGKQYARQIANHLASNVKAEEVKILYLPNLSESEDVSDWIVRGGTKRALTALADGCSVFDNNVKEQMERGEDTGLVLDPRDSRKIAIEFLEALFKDTLIYYKQRYFEYADGIYWELMDVPLDERLSKFLEYSSQIDRTKKIEGFKINNTILNNILRQIRGMVSVDDSLAPPFWRWPDDRLPNPKTLILMKSNVFDSVNRKIWGEFTPNLVSFHKLTFDFDLKATCKLWVEFLDKLCKHDPILVKILQQWFGYMMSNSKEHEKFLLIVGPTRGGKGTIIHVLTALLGEHNCAFPRISQLNKRFTFSEFIGKSAIIFNDVRTNRFTLKEAAVELLLSLTSRDRMSIDIKYFKIDSYSLCGRVIMSTNETPQFNDSTGAINERIIPVEFVIYVEAKDRDIKLQAKLLNILPGIFNWSLDGLDQLVSQGDFSVSEVSTEGIIGDIDSSRKVLQFVMEEYDYGDDLKDKESYVFVYNMWSDYVQWCDARRYNPGDLGTFSKELSGLAHKFKIRRGKKKDENKSKEAGHRIQERTWIGLKKKSGMGPDM